ncbi:MAG: hypothetical protein JSU79_03130 [Dehalococcoidales bacterium]|nr:MAG: hypothetical protein JSU79_03130 [Dehalococcoidales bacterium]
MGLYDKYVKPLTFTDYGYGSFRQGTRLGPEDLGMDVIIEFGTFWSAGKMGTESYRPHKHDFNQVLYWFSANTDDMSELSAEIELFLGEETERHMLTASTAVGIPAGMPHMPANILRMGHRFIFMEISAAAKYEATDLPFEKGQLDNKPLAGFRSKYQSQFIRVPFIRKGPWSYGQDNPDDSGGHLGVINGKDTGFDFIIMCESLKKAPYRFGPIPDKPHVHQNPEILLFMGANKNDLSQLGGEAEIALGKEMELHRITQPTAVIVPGGLPHNPLTITKVDVPFIMTDVRPFGMEPPSSRTSPDL